MNNSKSVNKKPTLKIKNIIFIFCALLALIGVVSVIRHFTYKEPTQYITVKFETDGGGSISPVRVVLGEKISSLPYAEKSGMAFTGWYLDPEAKSPFYRDTLLKKNTTLYAGYIAPDGNHKVYDNTKYYIPDCDSDYAIELVSDSRITSLNIGEYVKAEAIFGELPTLKVSSSGDKYSVIPSTGYNAGGLYRFSLCRDDVRFASCGDSVTELDIRIKGYHKDSDKKVTLVRDLAFISRSDITHFSDAHAFTLPTPVVDAKKLSDGSIICVGNGRDVTDENTTFFKISKISRQGSSCFITVKDAALSDVISSLDISFETSITQAGYFDIDPDRLKSSIKNSDSVRNMSQVIAAAFNSSKAVADLTGDDPFASRIDSEFTKDEAAKILNSIETDASVLYDGLEVRVRLGQASVSDFAGDFVGGDSLPENGWIALGIVLDYNATLTNGTEVRTRINITYLLNAVLCGTSNYIGSSSGFDYRIKTYSQTEVSVSSVAVRRDGDKEITVDISEEINGIVSGKTDSDRDEIVRMIKEGLGADRELVELCCVPLVKGSVDPVEGMPIFTADFALEYSFKLNLGSFNGSSQSYTTNSAASSDGSGLSKHSGASGLVKADIIVLDAGEFGIVGNVGSGRLEMYSNPLGAVKFDGNSYISGYLGIESSLSVSLTLGSDIVKSMGHVSFRSENGFYTDIYGYAHVDSTKNSSFESSSDGAFYIEAGRTLEMSASISSDYFAGYKLGLSEAGSRAPFYTAGSRYVPLELDSNIYTYYMNPESGENAVGYKVPLLSGKYLDLTTGKEESGNLAHSDNTVIRFSNRYFKFNAKTGAVYVDIILFGTADDGITAGTTELACEADIYYTGASRIFPTHSLAVDKSQADGTSSKKNNFDGLGELGSAQSNKDAAAALKKLSEAISTEIRQSRAQTARVIWLDSKENPESAGLGRTVTVTIKLETDQGTFVLERREVIAGYPVGAFDTGALLERYLPDGGWDIEPDNTVINTDMTFTYKVKVKQSVYGFVYFNGTEWVGEVRAFNIGDELEAPEGSEKSYDGMVFTRWLGRHGTNTAQTAIKIHYGIKSVHFNSYPDAVSVAKRRIVYGYSTDPSVETVRGTKEDVISAIFDSTVDMGACCYVAQYESAAHSITFRYENEDGTSYDKKFTLKDGSDPTPYSEPHDNAFRKFVGWDADGDGKADYFAGDTLPLVTKDTVYAAIYENISVTVYTYRYTNRGYGDKTAHIFNRGDSITDLLRAEAAKLPEAGSGEKYEFEHWEYSNDGESWYTLTDVSGYFVQAEVYFRPVWTRYVTVTFDAGEGYIQLPGAGKIKAVTKTVPADTDIPISGLYVGTPILQSNDSYDYSATGWRDRRDGKVYDIDGTINVSSSVTLTAVYEKTQRKYHITVSTLYGSIYGSQKKRIEFNVSFDESEPLKNIYTSNLPSDTDEDGYFRKCVEAVTDISEDGREISITYKWDTYICITFDASGGKFEDMSSIRKVYIPYNAEAPSEAERELEAEEIPVPDGVNILPEMKFLGWTDESGRLLSPCDSFLPLKNVVLSARWQAEGEKAYSITLDAGENGLFANGKRYFVISGLEGTEVGSLPGLPTDENLYAGGTKSKVMTGWSREIPVTFTSDVTIEALWAEQAVEYSVKYYVGDALYREDKVKAGDAVEVAEVPAPSEGQLPGHWEWYVINESGEEVLLGSEAPAVMPAYGLIARLLS